MPAERLSRPSIAEIALSNDQGGCAALRRTALPAPRSGLRPHARGRAWHPQRTSGSCWHPLPANCPASTGTCRERSASLRDGLRPLATEPGRESPDQMRLSEDGPPSQVSSVRLIAASSRLQRIRVRSSRCRAEGTREYARVAIRLTEVPSRHIAATQNPPHRNPGRPTSNSVIICHGTRTTLNKRRSARPSSLTVRCVRMISAASPRPIAMARKVTTSRAASESPGAALGRSPRRNDPASTQPMTPAINGAVTARQRLSGEANRMLATGSPLTRRGSGEVSVARLMVKYVPRGRARCVPVRAATPGSMRSLTDKHYRG